MPKVIWKLPDGKEVVAEVENGTTMMEAALDNDIPEIIGECGGCLSCATRCSQAAAKSSELPDYDV